MSTQKPFVWTIMWSFGGKEIYRYNAYILYIGTINQACIHDSQSRAWGKNWNSAAPSLVWKRFVKNVFLILPGSITQFAIRENVKGAQTLLSCFTNIYILLHWRNLSAMLLNLRGCPWEKHLQNKVGLRLTQKQFQYNIRTSWN